MLARRAGDTMIAFANRILSLAGLPPAEILRAKAKLAEYVLRRRHLEAGLVLPMFTEVYVGEEPMHVALFSATEQTARYLAALAFRAAIEPSDEIPGLLDQAIAAVERAHALTDTPGVLARGYLPERRAAECDFPGQEEQLRQGEGWVWLAGGHIDTYCAVFFSAAVLHDLCPSFAPRLTPLVCAVLDRWLEHSLTLTDVGGRPVPDCPTAPGTIPPDRRVVCLQVLQLLCIGHHLTGRPEYLSTYRELASDHEYAPTGVPITLPGLSPKDDVRAFEAYYHLVPCAQDPALRAAYLQSLRGKWARVKGEERVYLDLIGGAVDPEAGFGPELTDVLLRLEVVKEFPHGGAPDGQGPQSPGPVPVEQRPPTMFEWGYSPHRTWAAKTLLAPVDYLVAYWMARYHGALG